MQNFKFQNFPIELLAALENIKNGNKMVSSGQKLIENGKTYISEFLKSERKVDIENLQIGDILIVAADNGSFMVEIGSMNKFDERKFAVEQPALHNQYKREFAVKRFKV